MGCGTGRFTQDLADTFNCTAIGIEPSAAMLEVAQARPDLRVEWKQGSAEKIPLASNSIDLVFMSQVFHHLVDKPQSLAEIKRVLVSCGHLAIRNGTREHNAELGWLKFFPKAAEIEDERTPYANEISSIVTGAGFEVVAHQVINQRFASSAREYFDKIKERGLSSLIVLSDDDFSEGLMKFNRWVDQQPENQAAYEPVDLFVFRNSS